MTDLRRMLKMETRRLVPDKLDNLSVISAWRVWWTSTLVWILDTHHPSLQESHQGNRQLFLDIHRPWSEAWIHPKPDQSPKTESLEAPVWQQLLLYRPVSCRRDCWCSGIWDVFQREAQEVLQAIPSYPWLCRQPNQGKWLVTWNQMKRLN